MTRTLALEHYQERFFRHLHYPQKLNFNSLLQFWARFGLFRFLNKLARRRLGLRSYKAIAQWIHLCLPFCGPRFESHAHHLGFYKVKFCTILEVRKRDENKQKETGFGPRFKKCGKNTHCRDSNSWPLNTLIVFLLP